MRVLVTGGAGFIGSFVVDELVDDGHEVIVVDSLHPKAHGGAPEYLNPSAVYLWDDLRDPDVALAATAGVEAVSHQASMVGLGLGFGDAVDYVTNNDVATAVLLAALHDRDFSGRIVLGSSMVVYGEGGYRCTRHGAVRAEPRNRNRLERGEWEPTCPMCGSQLVAEPVTEDAPVDPRNVYAATKLHQEHLVTTYGREHGATTVVLRYHNVYGPRMPANTPYAGVASIFRSACQAGEPPHVLEDGRQRRDFVHVSDVARANVQALFTSLRTPAICNVGSGHPCTVLEMAAALTTAFGECAPEPVVVGGYRLGDVRHVFASVRQARELLGFSAAIPPDLGFTRFADDALRR